MRFSLKSPPLDVPSLNHTSFQEWVSELIPAWKKNGRGLVAIWHSTQAMSINLFSYKFRCNSFNTGNHYLLQFPQSFTLLCIKFLSNPFVGGGGGRKKRYLLSFLIILPLEMFLEILRLLNDQGFILAILAEYRLHPCWPLLAEQNTKKNSAHNSLFIFLLQRITNN